MYQLSQLKPTGNIDIGLVQITSFLKEGGKQGVNCTKTNISREQYKPNVDVGVCDVSGQHNYTQCCLQGLWQNHNLALKIHTVTYQNKNVDPLETVWEFYQLHESIRSLGSYDEGDKDILCNHDANKFSVGLLSKWLQGHCIIKHTILAMTNICNGKPHCIPTSQE